MLPSLNLTGDPDRWRTLAPVMLDPESAWPPDVCALDSVQGGNEERPIVLLAHPWLVKEVLIAGTDTWTRSRAHELIISQGLGPTSLFVVRSETWRRVRRALAPSFSRRSIESQADRFAQCATLMGERWKADRTCMVDIARAASVMTLALFWTRLVGAPIDAQALDEVAPAVESLIAAHRAGEAVRYVSLICAMVDEALARVGETFMDAVLTQEGSKFPLSPKERLENARTLLLAGHETTAVSLAWAVWLLAGDEVRQKRARDEVLAARETCALSKLSVSDLPFCNAVIKEGQRLYSPAHMTTRRAEREVKLGPMVLPKGTNVVCAFYAMHRRADQFDQPDSFVPERFLGPNAEPRDPFAFLPFSAGQRVCLAGPYADHSALILLAGLLSNWSFKRPDDEEAVRLGVTLSMQPATPLNVRLEALDGLS